MSELETHSEVHEDEDQLPRGLLLKIFFGVLITGIILSVVAYLVMLLRQSQLHAPREFPEQHLPAPHVVSGIRQQEFYAVPPRPKLFQNEEEMLHGYGWADRSHGLVRIPIDDAMQLVVEGVKP